jgi:hypothetical protein
VLYYIADMQGTLEEMNQLGKNCLVTIYSKYIDEVGPLLERIPGVRKDWFGRRSAQWLVATWPGKVQTGQSLYPAGENTFSN